MECVINRRNRQIRRLQDAINELNLALIECDYNPDSATQEEQVIVGIIATISLMNRDLKNRNDNGYTS